MGQSAPSKRPWKRHIVSLSDTSLTWPVACGQLWCPYDSPTVDSLSWPSLLLGFPPTQTSLLSQRFRRLKRDRTSGSCCLFHLQQGLASCGPKSRPDSAHGLRLYSLRTKNGLYHFKWLEAKSKEVLCFTTQEKYLKFTA